MRVRLGSFFAYNWEPVYGKDLNRNTCTRECGGFGISDTEIYKGTQKSQFSEKAMKSYGIRQAFDLSKMPLGFSGQISKFARIYGR